MTKRPPPQATPDEWAAWAFVARVEAAAPGPGGTPRVRVFYRLMRADPATHLVTDVGPERDGGLADVEGTVGP